MLQTMRPFGDRVLGADIAPIGGLYDVVVIGGGISGIQIARHAAGRGLRTILLEKDDYGGGTSSATTKLLHGGLRYLEQYDFPVVAESIAERRYLGIAAPHLVQPRSFLLTAFDWSEPKAPILGAGVALYESMAGHRNSKIPKDLHSRRFRWVKKDALLKQVPWLQPEGLVGAWRHDDTLNVHPERLLLSILGSYVQTGGTAVNHAEVTEVHRDENGRVDGVTAKDRLNGQEHRIRGTVTINAAGPWVEEVLGELSGKVGVKVRQAKGVHLLMKNLGNKDGVFVRGRNGRHIMVNPWEGRSLIGPTDTPTDGSADEAKATEEDVELILETIDSVAAKPLDRDAIMTTLVGVRPLVDDGSDTYRASRRFDIFDHSGANVPGIYTVTGGKWTTGRAMGARVIDILVEKEKLPPTRKFDSRYQPVAGAFGDFDTVGHAFESALSRFRNLPVPKACRMHLARLYGTAHEAVLGLVAADPSLGERISPDTDCLDIKAQIVYAVEAEAARTFRDILDRRLILGTMGPVSEVAMGNVVDVVVGKLGWDRDEAKAEADAYLAEQEAVLAVVRQFQK